jgi:hypothetical protein
LTAVNVSQTLGILKQSAHHALSILLDMITIYAT